MTGLFDYPPAGRFMKTMPKEKIYAHAGAKTKLKELFVAEVERIVWAYVLRPQTVNIEAGESVKEIQVLRIIQRKEKLHTEVLAAIDQSAPTAVVFELEWGDKVRPAAAYKQMNEVNSDKRVVGSYHFGEWLSVNNAREPLPLAGDMDELYRALLQPLLPVGRRENETLAGQVARAEELLKLQREAVKLQGRINREKQHNRRMELIMAQQRLNKQSQNLSK